MTRRTLATLAVAACLLVVGATAASAHVDLEPGEAVAGSTTTLTFSFHHGKDGSATTGLEVLLPQGSLGVEATSTSTSAPATTETTEDRPGTTLEAQARDDGGSPAPWLIGSGIAAALAVGLGGMLLKRRAGG